jgi:hypothetical protein
MKISAVLFFFCPLNENLRIDNVGKKRRIELIFLFFVWLSFLYVQTYPPLVFMDYGMNLSISLLPGEENKRDAVSRGDRIRQSTRLELAAGNVVEL